MKKPSLFIIFLTVFIDLIGFGVVLPLLPRYSERFGAEGFAIGAIISSYSLMQFFFAPMWGRLSDRMGRRPILLLSLAGSTLSYAMFALSAIFRGRTGLLVLIGSRVFAGICGANLSVASAYIADITTAENRSKGMGMIGMAFGLGFILGPALGAFAAAAFGLSGPGWVAAAFCGGNFIMACFVLSESRKPTSEHAAARPKLDQWIHTLRLPRLGLLIGIFFLATFCFTCFESTLPLLLGSSTFHHDDLKNPGQLIQKINAAGDPVSKYVHDALPSATMAALASNNGSEPVTYEVRQELLEGLNTVLKADSLYTPERFQGVALSKRTQKLLAKATTGESHLHVNRLLLTDAYPEEIRAQKLYFDEKSIGYLFAYCGIMAAFIQGGAIGRLVKRFGEKNLIYGSLFVVAISLAMIPYSATLAMLLFGLGLFAAGSGINRAPTMGLISLNSPPGEQGATLGVAQSAGTLARIFGPVFATGLYNIHTPLPYVICAGVATAAGLVAWLYLARGAGETMTAPVSGGPMIE